MIVIILIIIIWRNIYYRLEHMVCKLLYTSSMRACAVDPPGVTSMWGLLESKHNWKSQRGNTERSGRTRRKCVLIWTTSQFHRYCNRESSNRTSGTQKGKCQPKPKHRPTLQTNKWLKSKHNPSSTNHHEHVHVCVILILCICDTHPIPTHPCAGHEQVYSPNMYRLLCIWWLQQEANYVVLIFRPD